MCGSDLIKAGIYVGGAEKAQGRMQGGGWSKGGGGRRGVEGGDGGRGVGGGGCWREGWEWGLYYFSH